MSSFTDITDYLKRFIESDFNKDFASRLLESLCNLPEEQQHKFAEVINDHMFRIAPETTGNVSLFEGATLKYLWELYIYRAIWHVCCWAKGRGEILSAGSPCIIVLFVCLKVKEGYDISDVLSFFNLWTQHIKNEAVQV